MARSHKAPGPLAGFLWQIDLALLKLFQLDFGEHIEIETHDDVVLVRGAGGVLAYVQAKHSLRTATLGLRSPELWKTFSIWLPLARRLVESGVTSRFELATSLALQADLRPLSHPEADRSSVAQAEARKSLEAALTQVALEAPNKDLTSAYDAWLQAKEEERLALLGHTYLMADLGTIRNTGEEVEHQLRHMGVRPRLVREYRERVTGWYNDVVRGRLGKDGCSIEYDELNQLISELHETTTRDALPVLHAATPVPEMISAETRRLYQLQLQLLEASSEDHLLAYKMYTRARLEREGWLKLRITGHADLKEHEAELTNQWESRWQREQRSTESGSGNAIATGWRVFDDCASGTSAIRGVAVPHHVHVGSLHLLADQPPPCPSIGWHPKYRDLLPEIVGEGNDG